MIQMHLKSIFTITLAASIGLSAFQSASAATLAVKRGEKIGFLGDSITQEGNRKNGYISMVMEALNHERLEVSHIPAGKGGHKSTNMLARLESDVLSKNPDWMLLSCGVNDVWHFKLTLGNRTFEGVSLEDYKKNITEIVETALAADVKVMILTSTMIGEDPESELNQNLIPYNEFLREMAAKKDLPLADLSQAMHEKLKEMPDEKGKARMFGDSNYDRKIKNKLTRDGCHMNQLGNIMMAKGVLEAFGMSDRDIKAAEKRWLGK